MTATIRRATEADIPILARFEANTFPVPWSREAIRSHLAAGSTVTLLAEVEGEAVGYLFGLALPTEGEIFRVAVLPTMRGHGLGMQILTHFFSILRSVGAEACFLEVRRSNLTAQAVYQRAGFTVAGERKNYYKNPREDALVMVRRPI